MADIIDKTTNIAMLGIIAGILYMGYKIADGLGFFKKDGNKTPNKDEKPAGSLIPDSGNPLLDHVAKQPDKLAPTNTDLSKLTPGVQVPYIGPLRLGVPEVASGGVSKVANSISTPILGGVWNWAMNLRYGEGWQDRMKWTDKGWVPLSVNDENARNAINAVKSGGFASIVTGPGVPEKIAVPGLVPLSQVPARAEIVVTRQASQSMGGTGSEIQDTPGILDYLNIGPAKQSELDPAYRSVQGSTPKPSAYQNPLTRAVQGTGTAPLQGFIPVYRDNVRTEDTPPAPITIPAPPAKPADLIPSNPSMGSVPGVIYYDWVGGGVSRVPMSGYNWIQMSEVDARNRGILK